MHIYYKNDFICFQEASRIREDASKTKSRAEELLDKAQLLEDDVDDSEDQVGNLEVQANSDSDLADNVGVVKVIKLH